MISVRKIGSLSVGRRVDFRNTGELSSGQSYIGAIDNLTTALLNVKNLSSYFHNEGKVRLGNNVRIHKGFGIHVSKGTELSVGDNTYINPLSLIICHAGISIGSGCAISWKVEIMDDDLHAISYGTHSPARSTSIVIGNEVWIGSGVRILKGARIGDGAVIASGSVVTGTVDKQCLYGGVPARKIKEDVQWK